MDSLITAAARALAVGDPLGALSRVALRDDAPALALRGIAMAQLGDLVRARALVRQAAAAFLPSERVARARCVVAEAEIALAGRDLHWPAATLRRARAELSRHGDDANAAHAGLIEARRLVLVGRLADADQALATIEPAALPPALRASGELVRSALAVRRVRAAEAEDALARAAVAATSAGITALVTEIERARLALLAPAAWRVAGDAGQALRLHDVERLYASGALVVDACRHVVRRGEVVVALATRPVLFALARALAAAWPGDVGREALIAAAFGSRLVDDTWRARLRVEIGRLRTLLRDEATVAATAGGFRLRPRGDRDVVVLAPPIDDAHAAVLALLADGEAWSSSALALALGRSQRAVQRSLDALAMSGRARAWGRGRARRWLAPPLPGITTALLLPGPWPLPLP